MIRWILRWLVFDPIMAFGRAINWVFRGKPTRHNGGSGK